MTKKLQTRISTYNGQTVAQIERSNILNHEVDSVLKLQSMIWTMVDKVKAIKGKAEQKIMADSEVNRLASWVKDTLDWDAEEAIRELAKVQWQK